MLTQFEHLPFRVTVDALDGHLVGSDTEPCHWCFTHAQGAWECMLDAHWTVTYYFEMESDALLFKLSWFK